MNFLKNSLSLIINFLLYLFIFLFIFFCIYRAYIFRFGITPLPCMNNKCISERENSNF